MVLSQYWFTDPVSHRTGSVRSHVTYNVTVCCQITHTQRPLCIGIKTRVHKMFELRLHVLLLMALSVRISHNFTSDRKQQKQIGLNKTIAYNAFTTVII